MLISIEISQMVFVAAQMTATVVAFLVVVMISQIVSTTLMNRGFEGQRR